MDPIQKALKEAEKDETLMHLKRMVFWMDTLGMKTKVFDYEKDFTQALEHIKKCDGDL